MCIRDRDYAMNFLKEYGFINDRAYAESYVRSYGNRKSRRQLVYELSQKGVSLSLIHI